MLTLGYKAAAEQFPPRTLLDFGVLAEQSGFDSVWVSDQFHPWRHTNGHASFSLAWLAALGERTSRVLIGPGVLTPTLRLHPSVVAQAIGTLAMLYPGRVLLGVGTGEAMNEVPALGVAWPGYRERIDRLREAIDLIRELWSRDDVSFQGRYYRTSRATIYERPPDAVPLYVAGAGPQAARLAGEVGDGFICTSGGGVEACRDLLLAVAEGCRRVGRDAGSLTRMIEMKVSFDRNLAKARADTGIWAPLALRAAARTGLEQPRALERGAAAVVEAAEQRWIISSDPDEHVARIQPFVNLGFTHLVFHAPTEDQTDFIKLYSEEILPRLRAGTLRQEQSDLPSDP